MEYKTLSENFTIPMIGLGTWGIGGYMEADFSQDEKSIDAIKHAIALGYSHIDTAEVYGAGHTEEIIGQAIKNIDRSTLIITTKVFKTHLHYDDVILACKKSLERLQTDYIDIYLIHAPNSAIPIKETMAALNYLVKQWLVKYIGVSNFSVQQMEEAQQHSKNKIMVNQIPYNLATRNDDYKGNCIHMESEIIPYCQKNNILIIAYRPIERWFLLQSHPLLDTLSQQYGKTKAQIAMNWLISKKNIITISKSTNPEHLKENLGAMGWNLRDNDVQLLDITPFESPSSL